MPKKPSKKNGNGGPKLTLKQQKFLDAYLGDANGNATEAAKMAGYAGNDNTLSTMGAQNLRKRAIREGIRKHLETGKLAMNREERIALLTEFARGNDPYGKLDTIGEATRQGCIKLLSKIGRDYLERHTLEGPDGGPLQVQTEATVVYYPSNGREVKGDE